MNVTPNDVRETASLGSLAGNGILALTDQNAKLDQPGDGPIEGYFQAAPEDLPLLRALVTEQLPTTYSGPFQNGPVRTKIQGSVEVFNHDLDQGIVHLKLVEIHLLKDVSDFM